MLPNHHNNRTAIASRPLPPIGPSTLAITLAFNDINVACATHFTARYQTFAESESQLNFDYSGRTKQLNCGFHFYKLHIRDKL
ncbi:unnamed protein product [Lactuca virosa]|uniref:Uncharacterized protein n=1 Tax=Lactuca virosa TaxID=75947 RepID=A0AAU9M0X2_9ASTR|nr:unnamed protein product [Lactuca virosa]